MNRDTNHTKDSNKLKNMDFLAWKIGKDKRKIHRDEVNRIFAGRPRTRSGLH